MSKPTAHQPNEPASTPATGVAASFRFPPYTLVCFAMPEEARPFRRLIKGRAEVRVLETGVGQRNAEATLRVWLRQTQPRAVYTCGFAGGLNPAFRSGQILFETDAASPLRATLLAAGLQPARFLCADRILVTPAEKADQWRRTAADAVEMESEAIQAVCRNAGIPCATVRVISDDSEESLPLDFNRFMTANQRFNYAALGWTLIRSPSKIAELLRFQRRLRPATERLAQVLQRLIATAP